MLHKQITNNMEEEPKYSYRKPAFECTRGRVGAHATEGANRRKECVPYTLLSYRVRQTRLDVHPWRVFQLRIRTLPMTMPTTHLGMVIEQTSGEPCPIARVPSKQAMHAPRTETREFKMESQRQQSKAMNHLANKASGHTTQPESPV